MSGLKNLWRDHRRFLAFVVPMFVFRWAVADWEYVPSSSMNPTLWTGDRVVVDKLAYSLRIPFTLTQVARWAGPERGDVITFDSPADDVNLIKRVVAVAGDTVAMSRNVLAVNGEPLPRTLVADARPVPTESGVIEQQIWREHRAGVDIEVARLPTPNRATGFAAVSVPPGHVMVLGDNRDNSRDSRDIGFIDERRITGRAERVVLSHDPFSFWLPLHV